MNKVSKHKLGNTKHLLSRLGLGSVQFGLDYGFSKKKDQHEVNQILEFAWANGINFIDTASEYGDSEHKIGNYLSETNNRFVVATKLRKYTEYSADKLYDHIMKSVDDSLKRLNLPQIDILQLHQTDKFLVNNEMFWYTIQKLKSEKLIDSFGVSVYEVDEARMLIESYYQYINLLQVPYNVFDQRFSILEDLCSKYRIGMISRSALLKGTISCDEKDLPASLKKLIPYKLELRAISNSLSLKIEEIAIMFSFINSFFTSSIVGVDCVKELSANINAVNKIDENFLSFMTKLNSMSVDDPYLIDPRKWKDF